MFKGKNFEFELGRKTYIMGILNVTDDSFYDGGRYNSNDKALGHMKTMLEDGADIIDIGAQSTRPGHKIISSSEELAIIKNYLPYLYNETNAIISVDTFYPNVAEYALQNGASIINDVSGNLSQEMAEVIKRHNAGWIIMHTGGGDSDIVPEYKTDIVEEVSCFFANAQKFYKKYGLSSAQIMFDIGVGFGKTTEQSIEILRNLKYLKRDEALLVALSSKRIIGETTTANGYDRVYGTISANVLSAINGADFVRVHNVKENALALKMSDAILRG
jgi:dihydropteroate synthase